MDVIDIINRVKNLRYYEVVIAVPPLFRLSGQVPFTFKIEGDMAVCQVLAEDQMEADHRVIDYFNKAV